MTHYNQTLDITYIETKDDEDNFLRRDCLEILVFPDQLDTRQPDDVRVIVSTNIDVPLKHESDSAFRGFGVHEIVEPEGYTYANGPLNYFGNAHPGHDLKRTEAGVYKTQIGNTSITLVFTQAGNDRKALLSHERPGQTPRIREFVQLGNHDFEIA